MSIKQLVQVRNDLHTALATVQALIDCAVRDDAAKARAKRAARPRKVARTPSRDERVAIIREGASFAVKRTARVFNNLRKDGSRSVKVWEAMQADDIEHLRHYIASRISEATFELVHPTLVGHTTRRYLRVILPVLTDA